MSESDAIIFVVDDDAAGVESECGRRGGNCHDRERPVDHDGRVIHCTQHLRDTLGYLRGRGGARPPPGTDGKTDQRKHAHTCGRPEKQRQQHELH